MVMPFQPWRAVLQPASFNGCGFKVEAGSKPGGRRLATHEYPKGETPYTEDMGRRATRWQITGYCIGPNYLSDRDAVIAASNLEGPFTLVHPSFGSMQVHCELCVPTETREKGGFCAFEMTFVEAGSDPDAGPTADTQAQATSAADASNSTTASTVDSGLAGQTGGGVGGINAGAGSGDPADAATGVMGGYPSGINPGLATGSNGLVVGGV